MGAQKLHISNYAEMTVEDFKKWLMRFDADRDGRISREELGEAIRTVGRRLSWWRSRRGIGEADANGDGFIDEAEIENLVAFAQKTLGLPIVLENC